VNKPSQVNNSKVNSSVVNTDASNDMQLFIESSTPLKTKGKLQLTYLNEQFEGSFIATPNLIKLKTNYDKFDRLILSNNNVNNAKHTQEAKQSRSVS